MMKSETGKTALLKGGDVQISLECREVIVRSTPVKLPPVEYKLLELFLQNQNRALSREYLITTGWHGDVDAQNKSLDVYVRRLRKKIEDDPSKPRRIVTVRSYGYRFEPQEYPSA